MRFGTLKQLFQPDQSNFPTRVFFLAEWLNSPQRDTLRACHRDALVLSLLESVVEILGNTWDLDCALWRITRSPTV